jgi:PEP-CTERM motif
MKFSSNLSVFGAALLTSTAAMAVPTTFFGEDIKSTTGPHAVRPVSTGAEASFLSVLSGVSTEDFQSASGAAPIALTFTGSSGALGATVTSGGEINTSTSNGRWSINNGTNYLEADSSSFVLTFASQIAAFGFYGTDIGDFGGALSIELFSGATSLGLFQVGNTLGSGGSTNGSVLFFGLIDTVNTFDRIVFRNTDTTDIFGFDNMTIGDVRQVTGTVPVPGSIALLGLGLIGLAGLRKKSIVKP